MSAEHDWQAVGYWYRCRLCGQWQDEQHTPQCTVDAKVEGRHHGPGDDHHGLADATERCEQ